MHSTKIPRTRLGSCAALACLAVAAAAPSARGGILTYASSDENGLVTFDSSNPQRLIEATPRAFRSNDEIIGLDARPTTGRMVGVVANGNEFIAYELTGTGPTFSSLFIEIGNGSNFVADPADTTNPYNPQVGLRGTRFGVTFEENEDTLHLISNARQFLTVRLNPAGFGGLVTTGPELRYASGDAAAGVSPNVAHIATYDGLLYGIDSATVVDAGTQFQSDRLVTIDRQTGEVRTVARLPDVTAVGGFDILSLGGDDYAAYLAVQLTNSPQTYFTQIDLTTGAYTNLVPIDGGDVFDGLAIPEPSSAALLGLAGVLALGRRRRR